MLKRLTDHGSDVYSQFGEDGMIEVIFAEIVPRTKICVEFGASDGQSCSNTRNLWMHCGWQGLLIEGNTDLYVDLRRAVRGQAAAALREYIRPDGEHSIDAILAARNIVEVDFMSIDVDSMDYVIWEHMSIKPRVVCIEYNQSIPPHVSIHQESWRDCFGASAKALLDLGLSKGYQLVGMNKANMFFVLAHEVGALAALENRLEALFPYEGLTYLATDYKGRPFIVGSPPWGLLDEPFIGDAPVDRVGTTEMLVEALSRHYRETALFLGQDNIIGPAAPTDKGIEYYNEVFSGHPLVIVDMGNLDLSDSDRGGWVVRIAEEHGYEARWVRGLRVFNKENV